ncbi:hypothetical protein CMO83_05070 [Candidatus Woesearchaeota archaeon]|nr:hypothetical protein [Candidatus Woesearchaeota archaeon]
MVHLFSKGTTHWTWTRELFKLILLLKTEKENTQNFQIKFFGFHQNPFTQFRLTFSFSSNSKVFVKTKNFGG